MHSFMHVLSQALARCAIDKQQSLEGGLAIAQVQGALSKSSLGRPLFDPASFAATAVFLLLLHEQCKSSLHRRASSMLALTELLACSFACASRQFARNLLHASIPFEYLDTDMHTCSHICIACLRPNGFGLLAFMSTSFALLTGFGLPALLCLLALL